MGMNEGLAALLSLVAGAVMSVTVSCVWTVLHLPARLQDVFQAGRRACLHGPCCRDWRWLQSL